MKHNTKRDLLRVCLPLLSAILFSSCGVPTRQILPVATGDNPPAGKCLIIVERDSTSIGAWVNNEVYDNGTHVGTLTSGGKLAWLRDSGPMSLLADVDALKLKIYRNLSVGNGKTYRYKAHPRGLNGPGALHTIIPGAGPIQEFSIHVGNSINQGKIPTDLCQECGAGNFKPECPAWASHSAALALVSYETRRCQNASVVR